MLSNYIPTLQQQQYGNHDPFFVFLQTRKWFRLCFLSLKFFPHFKTQTIDVFLHLYHQQFFSMKLNKSKLCSALRFFIWMQYSSHCSIKHKTLTPLFTFFFNESIFDFFSTRSFFDKLLRRFFNRKKKHIFFCCQGHNF